MNEKPTSPGASRERSGFELVGPRAVLTREDLGRDEKVELLRQWEQDLREQMVAEEENMPSSQPLEVTLDEVLNALRELGAGPGPGAPTKHG